VLVRELPQAIFVGAQYPLGPNWTQPSYSDVAWSQGAAGFGFDSAPDYLAQIGTNLGSQMLNIAYSVYLRRGFNLSQAEYDGLTATTLTGGQQGQILSIDCPPTQRCVSVQVDQVSGVGTVIKTGDYVDMVVGFNVAVLTPDATGSNFTVVPGVDGSTVKLILQGMQVMGTLLPPPPAATQAQDPNAPAASPGTTLSGQQEIVILSVTAQQAEVIKFAQLRADPTPSGITLLLRSPQDFIDPATNLPFENGPIPDATTGVIFKVLVDQYGVLPPNIVEVVLPTPKP